MTTETMQRLSQARARFPRSAGYDQQWLIDNAMGPHPLWLLEWLWPALDLPQGAVGRLAIALPALVAEFADDRLPEHLRDDWTPDCWTFHSARWWRQLWTRGGTVEVEFAELLDGGWLDWAAWNEARAELATDNFARRAPGQTLVTIAEQQLKQARMVRRDAGRNLGLAGVVARRLAEP